MRCQIVPVSISNQATTMGSKNTFFCVLALFECFASAEILLRRQTFNNGRQGWSFRRRGTSSAYSSGSLVNGELSVRLGGTDDERVEDMIGGWVRAFSVAELAQSATIQFDFSISQSSNYETDEESGIYVEFDDVEVITVATSILAGGGRKSGTAVVDLGRVTSGRHTVFVGVYNTKKTFNNEFTTATIDNILIEGNTNGGGGAGNGGVTPNPNPGISAAQAVNRLTLSQFRQDIASLANFGDRRDRTARNNEAARWLERQLEQLGYRNVRRARVAQSTGTRSRYSVFATKEGRRHPDAGMYIVSCHFDGLGNGGGRSREHHICFVINLQLNILASFNTLIPKSCQ